MSLKQNHVFQICITFSKIGPTTFGGGYAMIPVIELEVSNHGWLSTQEFTDVIAIAGMSPGPIATNSVIIVGYKTAGLPGVISSSLGIVLPSLIIILTIFKLIEHSIFSSWNYITNDVLKMSITQLFLLCGCLPLQGNLQSCLVFLFGQLILQLELGSYY